MNMNKKVLVTGGAGFIGSHIVDELLHRGYKVKVYDNLEPQVHGWGKQLPCYFNKEAEFILGDMRDRERLRKALRDVEVVFHEAAAVGVGQSMYKINHYVSSNTLGGAVLLDILANEPHHKVEKIIVASSMSVYGEGAYHCRVCGPVYPSLRSEEQLLKRDWEMYCPHCLRPVTAASTGEDKPLSPTSIYAISKRDHEEMFLSVGRTYHIPTVALRYFNVYGQRQALSNPYTGAVAIFSSRLLNGKPPIIYEDGMQSRDFIHVRDIVNANMLALETEKADYEVFNVGTGRRITILELTGILAEKLNFFERPMVVNQFRAGDIRDCYSSISKIRSQLGFEAQVGFEDGISELIEWVRSQTSVDEVDKAFEELKDKGLTV